MNALVVLVDERPDAVEVPRGRSFARAFHWSCMSADA
jgi:hypothetical protein